MEVDLLTKIFTLAPGTAGMAYLAWLSYNRSTKSEEHVQKITDSFLTHIRKKDEELTKEASANRQMTKEMQQSHASYYKQEQDKFSQMLEKLITQKQ